MENAGLMKKDYQRRAGPEASAVEPFRGWLSSARVGDVLAGCFGLLFLFQCMILPLVGKAAMGGSGSPGAGPADTVWKNLLFFCLMLAVTLAAGALALYSKWLRRQREGGAFPLATAGVLALTVGLMLAFVSGLLRI